MPQKTSDGGKEGYGFVVLSLTVIAFFVICHFGFLREDDWLTHFEASSLSDVFRQTRMFYLTRGGRWFSVASQYLFAGPLGEYKICFDLVNTLVFLALRRRHRDVSYFAADGECDFVVKERHAVSGAVQACIRLTDECKDREIEGLLAAMDACSLRTGTIVTEEQRDTLDFGGRRIDVVPFWDWCR